MTNCGAASEGCCTSLEVPGGMYYRTYTNSGDGGTGEANPASVSGFVLDKYEVTVGRFRQFVAAWNNGAGYAPPAGSGKHTYLNGGQGLANSGSPGTYEPGWVVADDSNIAPTSANLACSPDYATWTTSAGSNENRPINCVNWYEACAFCIWDGGFLPSEAEWEYAAAAGSQQRKFPWGNVAPGTSTQYAIDACNYGGTMDCTGTQNVAPVGTATLGIGAWGQLDLDGNVGEWTLDWDSSYVDPCSDCGNLTAASSRVQKGGDFTGPLLSPPYNESAAPAGRFYTGGVRCARAP